MTQEKGTWIEELFSTVGTRMIVGKMILLLAKKFEK